MIYDGIFIDVRWFSRRISNEPSTVSTVICFFRDVLRIRFHGIKITIIYHHLGEYVCHFFQQASLSKFKSTNTVDGRNPANHLGCIKPCK